MRLTFCFIVAITAATGRVGRCLDTIYTCENQWELHGQYCYLDVFNQPWDILAAPQPLALAQETCRNYGGALPTVHTRNENRLLRDAKGDIWIGLIWRNPEFVEKNSKAFQITSASCKDPYCWIDGKPLSGYNAFESINDELPIGLEPELCTVLSVSTGKWYLANCTERHYYWCRVPATPIQRDPAPICSGHGQLMCICEKGFTGEECQMRRNNTRLIQRCLRFIPKIKGYKPPAGLEPDCPNDGDICMPDDLDCLEDTSCKDPIGWCLPKN